MNRSLGRTRYAKARLISTLTQQELATLSGLSLSYVKNVERGSRKPSLTAVLRYAAATGVEPGWLLGEGPARRPAFSLGGPRKAGGVDVALRVRRNFELLGVCPRCKCLKPVAVPAA